MSYPVYFINAFAEGYYQGNTAAVVIVDEFPEQSKLQALAKEFNFSETVFVKAIAGGRFHIRWFTPEVEVALCGHGTLAAAKALFAANIASNDRISFDSLSGELIASKKDELIELDFPVDTPVAFEVESAVVDLVSPNQPVEILYAAKTNNLILVYASPEQVLTMQPDFAKLTAYKSNKFFGIAVTAAGTNELDYICRYFAPWEGINEDPVTGSAQTFLAPYWGKRLGKNELEGFQASQRGGRFHLEVKGTRVLISGKAFIYLKGEIADGW